MTRADCCASKRYQVVHSHEADYYKANGRSSHPYGTVHLDDTHHLIVAEAPG